MKETTMIDLSRIRSLKTLDQMKKDLTSFINEPIIQEIYLQDLGWGEEDLEADKDAATYLIELIEARHKSLAKHLANPKPKRQAKPTAETVSSSPVVEGQ